MSERNYYCDRRVMVADVHNRGRVDGERFIVTVEDEDGYEVEHSLPLKYEVCSTCRGKGRHVNPSIDCDGITAEDFAEDPDFAESYLRGDYDQPCTECNGERVVATIDDNALSDAEREVARAYDEKLEAEWGFAAEIAAERAMGC